MTTFCFSVQADATPGALPRVLGVFALHGHVPERCHAHRAGSAGEDLVVDVQLDVLGDGEAAAVARRLGRVVGVASVLWSEKERCAA